MKNQSNDRKDRQKKFIISLLYLGALIIVFLGIFYSAYSVINDINIKVLNSSIPGMVFGMLVAYLGVRYYFQVSNFRTEFLKSNAEFSWSNFKKEKKVGVKIKRYFHTS